ncbi:AAA family ATPase [Paraflavitalea speifideaquila]|uniref:AAA family ATPase n=1 Tax=Paraflavitalea speifideaquila TaxID=3076558 RepID=UPI0028ED5408|nr:AAA family ATPase [Paraflavitalea speifideiaquila]
MFKQIDIEGFRSIKQQSIPLKKINILYGPNGSGKSSVLYAPYIFRNFFLNPTQRLDSLFNLGFINLGGFENVTFKQNTDHLVKVSFIVDLQSRLQSRELKIQSFDFKYSLTLDKDVFPGSEIVFKFNDIIKYINLDFPYSLTQKKEVDIGGIKMLWNGLTFEHVKGVQFYFEPAFNSVYEDIKI